MGRIKRQTVKVKGQNAKVEDPTSDGQKLQTRNFKPTGYFP
jgi:hypothetical protein